MKKRKLDICIISDIHLGTYGSHAKECLQYLKSIDPQLLILNGDIIDLWNLKNKYFDTDHMELINQIMKMSSKGSKVYYLVGNHDERLRYLSKQSLGNIHIREKLVLTYNKKKYWIFHGDVFDASLKLSPMLAKLGGKGYDLLIKINRLVNVTRKKLGLDYVSFSKKVKARVKRGVKLIRDFEKVAINLAIENNYDYVICGHIHEPVIREANTAEGSVVYMNSGDWVENLTALELNHDRWTIYEYNELDYALPVNEKIKIPTAAEEVALDTLVLNTLKGV